MKKLLVASAALAALIQRLLWRPTWPSKRRRRLPLWPTTTEPIFSRRQCRYSVGRDPTTVSAISGITVVNNEKFGLSPTSSLAGGQLDYNWRIHNLVLGVEANRQWTNQKLGLRPGLYPPVLAQRNAET